MTDAMYLLIFISTCIQCLSSHVAVTTYKDILTCIQHDSTASSQGKCWFQRHSQYWHELTTIGCPDSHFLAACCGGLLMTRRAYWSLALLFQGPADDWTYHARAYWWVMTGPTVQGPTDNTGGLLMTMALRCWTHQGGFAFNHKQTWQIT